MTGADAASLLEGAGGGHGNRREELSFFNSCSFSDINIVPGIASALNGGAFTSLTLLSFVGCRLDDHSIAMLLGPLSHPYHACPSLTHLSFRVNFMFLESAKAIITLLSNPSSCPHLTSLDLSLNPLTSEHNLRRVVLAIAAALVSALMATYPCQVSPKTMPRPSIPHWTIRVSWD